MSCSSRAIRARSCCDGEPGERLLLALELARAGGQRRDQPRAVAQREPGEVGREQREAQRDPRVRLERDRDGQRERDDDRAAAASQASAGGEGAAAKATSTNGRYTTAARDDHGRKRAPPAATEAARSHMRHHRQACPDDAGSQREASAVRRRRALARRPARCSGAPRSSSSSAVRPVAQAHGERPAVRAVERVLDDPVRGQLDPAGQRALVAADVELDGAAAVAGGVEQRAELGERRLRRPAVERRTPSSARMSLSESRPRRSIRAKSSSRSASAIISRSAVARRGVELGGQPRALDRDRQRGGALALAPRARAVRAARSAASRRAGADETRRRRRSPAHSGTTKASAAGSMIGSVSERNTIAARTSARPASATARPGAERVEDEQRRRDRGAAAAGRRPWPRCRR